MNKLADTIPNSIQAINNKAKLAKTMKSVNATQPENLVKEDCLYSAVVSFQQLICQGKKSSDIKQEASQQGMINFCKDHVALRDHNNATIIHIPLSTVSTVLYEYPYLRIWSKKNTDTMQKGAHIQFSTAQHTGGTEDKVGQVLLSVFPRDIFKGNTNFIGKPTVNYIDYKSKNNGLLDTYSNITNRGHHMENNGLLDTYAGDSSGNPNSTVHKELDEIFRSSRSQHYKDIENELECIFTACNQGEVYKNIYDVLMDQQNLSTQEYKTLNSSVNTDTRQCNVSAIQSNMDQNKTIFTSYGGLTNNSYAMDKESTIRPNSSMHPSITDLLTLGKVLGTEKESIIQHTPNKCLYTEYKQYTNKEDSPNIAAKSNIPKMQPVQVSEANNTAQSSNISTSRNTPLTNTQLNALSGVVAVSKGINSDCHTTITQVSHKALNEAQVKYDERPQSGPNAHNFMEIGQVSNPVSLTNDAVYSGKQVPMKDVYFPAKNSNRAVSRPNGPVMQHRDTTRCSPTKHNNSCAPYRQSTIEPKLKIPTVNPRRGLTQSSNKDYKNTRDINHRDTRDIDHRNTRDINHRDTKGINHRNTRDINHRDTKGINHRNTGNIDHKNTRGIDHRNTGNIDHKNTGNIDHKNTRGIDHRNTGGINYNLSEKAKFRIISGKNRATENLKTNSSLKTLSVNKINKANITSGNTTGNGMNPTNPYLELADKVAVVLNLL